MLKDIYDPLTEYDTVFRDRFKEVAKTTFAELAEEANVDVETNRQTCKRIYEKEREISSIETTIFSYKFLRVVLWFIELLLIYLLINDMDHLSDGAQIGFAISIVLLPLFIFLKVNSIIKNHRKGRDDLVSEMNQLKDEAWAQMAPLNRLYDWDVLTRMMSKTVPKLEFDPYFTTQRLADLRNTYGWDDSFNEVRSVIYSHSGLINGNPFVICRTRKMTMGLKTYEGSKTIYWTTRERDANGRWRTVQHSETLYAYVTADYPFFYEKTRLLYGNTAAPDLVFNRQKSGLAQRKGTFSFWRHKRKLRKKARNLTSMDFAMMTNEDFEVAFNTSDRNNNQQFALLFTPLAQESMMNLLSDDKVGYGDDFDFLKDRMINTIVPDHMQELDLDMNPDQYRHFDYDKAQAEFYKINANYFRVIYFALAPLLCVPMYQQIRPQHDIYGRDMERRSSFWEHEALANFWGQDKFMHPACVTDCILKTSRTDYKGDSSRINVYAHGYRREERVSYESVWGGDGRYHNVPVYWYEYFPVTGTGAIHMKEDNDLEDDSVSHRQRINHINDVLNNSNLDIYRRHIASRV